MRHLFLINPAAGKYNRTAMLTEQIRAVFSARGEPFEIEITARPGHAETLARRAAEDGIPTVLYVCGGDGTLGEAAQALPGHPQLALAPVPTGTGNDFIRSFGEKAQKRFCDLAALAAGHIEEIDLLRAAGRISLNIVSCGLDASIAQGVAGLKRIPAVSGAMAYQLSAALCLMTSLHHRYRFLIDGEPGGSGDYIFAIAANGRYYGGGFYAAPLSDLQDGLIDFMSVPVMSRLRLLPMIGSYRRGEHLDRYPFLRLRRCRTVQILSDDPVGLNLDGEVFRVRDPLIEVLPRAARLLLPEGYSPMKRRGAETASAGG